MKFCLLAGVGHGQRLGRASTAFANLPPNLPVPASWTVCVPAASLMFKVAVRAPVAVGLNVTVTVQSQPALRLVPPTVTLLIVSDVFWSLVRITVYAFFAPTVTDP